MNPRQRRGALLLALTALCAVGVFLGVMSYVSNISTQVGPTGPVLKLTRDVAALEPIEPDMVEEVQVPRRWIPSTAVTTTDATLGLVAGTDYTAGSILQEGMLVPRPGIQPGYREVAIVVDAETGVAGKVGSGDRVDIIATTEATDTEPARSE
ncbi:MAG: Flp pilus assembly protein CpaB, partial [Cellulomonadaceae bacterium]